MAALLLLSAVAAGLIFRTAPAPAPEGRDDPEVAEESARAPASTPPVRPPGPGGIARAVRRPCPSLAVLSPKTGPGPGHGLDAELAPPEPLELAIPEEGSLLGDPTGAQALELALRISPGGSQVTCRYATPAGGISDSTGRRALAFQSCSDGARPGAIRTALSLRASLPGPSSRAISGELAVGDASACLTSFVDAAAAATEETKDLIRARLADFASSSTMVAALCRDAAASVDRDPSRALIDIGLLGEMHRPQGASCLGAIMALPWPTTGTCLPGEDPSPAGRCAEIGEQQTLAWAQMKAIDGLAYAGSTEGDAAVFQAARAHPSAAVRREAVAAYLWNHGSTDTARERIRGELAASDKLLADIVIRDGRTPPAELDGRMQEFAQRHPEARLGLEEYERMTQPNGGPR